MLSSFSLFDLGTKKKNSCTACTAYIFFLRPKNTRRSCCSDFVSYFYSRLVFYRQSDGSSVQCLLSFMITFKDSIREILNMQSQQLKTLICY